MSTRTCERSRGRSPKAEHETSALVLMSCRDITKSGKGGYIS